jgi:nitrite reductase/ring-hydroxylating ferredoxin subunit
VTSTEALRETLHRIEQAEVLDTPGRALQAVSSRLTRSDAVKNALSGTWLGHRLHPMLTDVPIGAWVGAAVLDLVGGRRSGTAARRLVGLGILAALPTAASGLADWEDTHGGDQRVATVHAGANSVGLVLQVLSWRARGKGHGVRGRALSMAALGAVTAGGYLGGHLVFNLRVGVDAEQRLLSPGSWHDAIAVNELVDDAPHGLTIDGAPVVVVKHGDALCALSAICTHAGGPLAQGAVADGAIRCPWHGSEFSLDDGSVRRGPATTPECVYQTRVQDGMVQVRARTEAELAVDLTVV